jgi:hypothetical protein
MSRIEGLVVLHNIMIIWEMLGICGWKEPIVIGCGVSRRGLPFLHKLLGIRRVQMLFSVPLHFTVMSVSIRINFL